MSDDEMKSWSNKLDLVIEVLSQTSSISDSRASNDNISGFGWDPEEASRRSDSHPTGFIASSTLICLASRLVRYE